MRFSDLNWSKISLALSPAAKLVRLSPTKVQIYLYPYGHIEMTDNGGELNVSWSAIQGLELPLPDSVQVERFRLGFSIPYDIAGIKEAILAKNLKNALDKARSDCLGFQQYLYLPCEDREIRVVEFNFEPSVFCWAYLVQYREKGNDRWEIKSYHKERRDAIEYALKLEEKRESIQLR